MSKRLILGLLLALMAVLLLACEVEQEVEEPEPTLAAQTPAAATAQATPRLPAEASPTPQGTPTPPAEASPTPPGTPEPAATPTPEPGACPVPYRTTPADFAQPPQLRHATEIPGQRFTGGVRYSEAYVTVDLPPGREFIISSAWSHDESNLVTSIYDAQTGSSLLLRGDGCEIGRFVRDPAADAVFDEVMRSLKIGSTYACPIPVRSTPADLPVPDEPPPEGAVGPWRVVEGGGPFELGPLTLNLPAGREFRVGGGISDPGGEFFTVTDAETGSGVFLRPDGCETGRLVRDPAAEPILDEIVRTLEVASR